MSVTQRLNRWLNRTYRLVAIVLVAFAVLLSAVRLLIPYGDGLRESLEDYLAKQYNGQITIERLSTDWGSDGPVLVAENVTLVESDGLSITIGAIDLRLDFWASISQQQLITSYFTLNQAIITFDEELFVGQGTGTGNAANIELIDNLLNLFLHQITHFKVNDSHIYFADIYGKMRHLAISRLSWNNQGLRHQAAGDFEIVGFSSNKARFILDLFGKKLPEMKGFLYTQGTNIDLSPLIRRVEGISSDTATTDLNFEMWANIEAGRLQSVQVDLGENRLSWQDTTGPRELTLAPGQLMWQRTSDDGQQDLANLLLPSGELTSSSLAFTLDNEVDYPFTISGQHFHKDLKTHVSGVNLHQLAAAADIFIGEDSVLKQLDQLAVVGEVKDLHIHSRIEPNIKPQFSAVAQLSDLAWLGSDTIPGIEQLDGELVYQGSQLSLSLNSDAPHQGQEQLALDFKSNFSRPIPYQSLAVMLNASWTEQGFKLVVPEIALTSSELSLSGEMVFEDNENLASPYMAIYALVENADASKTQYYLPLSIMSDDLVNYLNTSIYSGTLATTRVLFNGPVSNYPFVDETGIFKVEGLLKNGKFAFDPEWPAINQLDAILDFTNDGMRITVQDGDLTGLNPKGTVASIESFSNETILVVESDVFASPQSLKSLMDNSPLADSVGQVLEVVHVQELVTGDFKLTLPFANLDNTVAEGNIKLFEHHVELDTPEMSFSQVTGTISFVNDDVSYPNIALNWRGLPMTLSGKSYSKEDFYTAELGLAGLWQTEQWRQQLPQALQHYGEGELDWQGQINLFFPPENGFSYEANVRSDLVNLAVMLPEPYAKNKQDVAALTALVRGNDKETTITATLDEQLEFYGKLDHKSVHFDRAHLVLGNDKMLLPMDGFHITASFDEIAYKPWQDLVMDIIASLPSGGEGEPLIDSPERIRGNVNELDVWGQKFNALSFNVLDQEDWWLVQLNADKARAQVKLHHNIQAYGVDVDADFIHLENDFVTEPVEDDSSFNQSIHDTLVPIRLTCTSCRYQLYDLGQVDAELIRDEDNNIALKSFTGRRKGFDFSLNGIWRYNQGQNSTHIAGAINADDFDRELSALDYSSIVRDSGLSLSYEFDWSGAPQEFAIGNTDGAIRMELDDGYLEDVDDKGARLLTVFSMKSLVRKLSLDFRDVFSNGMFYEDIKGDFTLEKGVFSTDNVKMNGAAGDILVIGTTDLNNQTLNYKMGFTPKVTSSIPVLVAWMVNPVAGLATLAVDKMIHSAEVIAKINFELTGTIDDPQFREVNRRSRDVQVDTVNDQIVDKPKTEPKPASPEVPQKPRKFNQSNLQGSGLKPSPQEEGTKVVTHPHVAILPRTVLKPAAA